MKKLIVAVVAVAALTACSPLAPVAHFDRSEVVVPPGECSPAREGECSVPETAAPVDPACVPEGGIPCYEGGVPVPTTTAVPPTPNVCEPGEAEGGVTC
jgi:hypothetical protein